MPETIGVQLGQTGIALFRKRGPTIPPPTSHAIIKVGLACLSVFNALTFVCAGC
jgi:hypothetical protein